MNSSINYHQEFLRADTNHNGKVDEREFRSFLGPVKQVEQSRASQFTKEDLEAFNVKLNSIIYILFYLILFHLVNSCSRNNNI